jgi:uncharacterized protein YuzE
VRLTYDPRHNIAYLRLQEKGAEVETIHISEALNVDLAPDGTVRKSRCVRLADCCAWVNLHHAPIEHDPRNCRNRLTDGRKSVDEPTVRAAQ